MPARCASCGVAKAAGSPNSSISPASALWAPDRIFSRVDFPAPFSPRRAWISDGPTSRWTFSRARTPGKRLLTPVILRIGSSNPAEADGNAAGAWAIQKRSLLELRKRRRRVANGAPPRFAGLLHFAQTFGRVEIFLGDRHRRQKRDLLRGFRAILEETGQNVDAGRALLTGELLDRRGDLAVADLAKSLGQGVEADDDDVLKVARFDRFERAERHVVVGGDDHLRRRRQTGKRRLGDRQALGAVEARGLLEDDLVLVLRLVEHVVQTLVAIDRRACARLALQVDEDRPVREQLLDQFALRLAALDVVGADMAEDAGHRRHPAVDGHDGHLGVHRLLQRRRHGVDLVRREHDALDALGKRRLDVGGLLRRGDLAVALKRRIALLDRFGLEGLHHMDEERKRQSRHRDENGSLVIGKSGRGQRDGEQARGYDTAGKTHGWNPPSRPAWHVSWRRGTMSEIGRGDKGGLACFSHPRTGRGFHAISIAIAVASPPPMQSDATPRFAPRARNAAISVTRMRAPEAPIG